MGQLVQYVCSYKQYYTQRGGLVWYDEFHGFQLYQTNPSWNSSGWKATVIGANNQAGKSLLKTEYLKGDGKDKKTTGTSTAGEEKTEEGEVIPNME
jgi:20S proteasome subunit alpha 3